MPRTRTLPPDRHWVAGYLARHNLDMTPEATIEALDADQWRRMHGAYRQYRHTARTAARTLAPDTWIKLDLISKHMGGITVEAAIDRLANVRDLGALVRDK